MKHILLQFAEFPQQENIDMSIVEYDHDLNLNVLKGTKTPAVSFTDQATATETKAGGEGIDSDRDMRYSIGSLLDTSTQTREHNEMSDSDLRNGFTAMLQTSTQTFVHNEVSDSDKDFRDVDHLSVTNTLTESSEALDSDK